jgi:hypothetical protein
MIGINSIGTRFEVFNNNALSTKSGLLKDDLVLYNGCVISQKEHIEELKKQKEEEKIKNKIMTNTQKWKAIITASDAGPFIRPKIRY